MNRTSFNVTAILLLMMLLSLSGCRSPETDLASWVGTHRDDLYRTWGPAHQDVTLSSGHHLLVYQYGSQMFVPAGGIIHSIPRSCRIQFETDERGVIIAWTYQGQC